MITNPSPLLLILESLSLLRGWCKRGPVIPWTRSSTSRTCPWTAGRGGILSSTKLVDEGSYDEKENAEEDQEEPEHSEVLAPPGGNLSSESPDNLLRLRGTKHLLSRSSLGCCVGGIQLFLLENIGLSDAKSIRYFLGSCSCCCNGGIGSLLLVLQDLHKCLEDTPGVRLSSSCPHAAVREESLSIAGEKLLSSVLLSGEDSSLDSSSIGNSFVRVDT